MTFNANDIAVAIRWAWACALETPPSRAALDQWHDIGERLHGMRLLLSTAPDSADRAALLEAVDTLDDLAGAHYHALAAELYGWPREAA